MRRSTPSRVTRPAARLGITHKDGWTLIDWKYGSCISFATREEARHNRRFCTAYIGKHGDINLLSSPYNLNDPPAFPDHSDPRFEYDRRTPMDETRTPIRPEFEAEITLWFAAHPEEHRRWLHSGTGPAQTQEPAS